jgi:hypothetical protein
MFVAQTLIHDPNRLASKFESTHSVGVERCLLGLGASRTRLGLTAVMGKQKEVTIVDQYRQRLGLPLLASLDCIVSPWFF